MFSVLSFFKNLSISQSPVKMPGNGEENGKQPEVREDSGLGESFVDGANKAPQSTPKGPNPPAGTATTTPGSRAAQ